MRFAYARRGGPLLDWSGSTPPYPTRAGETRSLGAFYPTNRTSNALRRYGGAGAPRGAAVGYEHNRELGYWGAMTSGHGGSGYHPPPGMGAFDLPRPGAPEVVAGYESPAPGAAVIHLGHGHTMQGYMPEGAARRYGQQMLGADAPQAFPTGVLRKISVLAAAYHGVKRNHGSVMWGLLWGLAAYVSPLYGVLVPAIGVAQGYGQAKGPKSNPAMRTATRKKRRRMFAKQKQRRATRRRTAKRRPRNVTRQRTSPWGTRPGY
jgi:hypothetical protein